MTSHADSELHHPSRARRLHRLHGRPSAALAGWLGELAGASGPNLDVTFVGFYSVCLFICLFACLHACFFDCFFVCMLAFLFVCLFIRSFVCLFDCLLL
jgi:hypothetical protein